MTENIDEALRQLGSRALLIGPILRRRASTTLAARLRSDETGAVAKALAVALGAADSDLGERILQVFDAIDPRSHVVAVDVICTVWVATRTRGLGEVIRAKTWVAAAPPNVRVLSCLQCQREVDLDLANPDIIQAVAAACGDPDPRLREAAERLLRSARGPALASLARTLLELPPAAQVAAQDHLAAVGLHSEVAMEVAMSLANVAVADAGAASDRAVDVLNALTVEDSDAIDGVCEVWAATRSPRLTDLLQEHSWVANRPLELRVLTALRFGRPSQVPVASDSATPLLRALSDVDSLIADRARQQLPALEKDESALLTLATGAVQAPLPSPDAVFDLLARNATPAVIDLLCDAWYRTRRPDLAVLLARTKWVARAPTAVRFWTALKAGVPEQPAAGPREWARLLLEACDDDDRDVARTALDALGDLPRESDAMLLLAEVVETVGLEVGNRIAKVLFSVKSPRVVDAICALWAGSRSSRIGNLLANTGWVASGPADVRLLTALRAGKRLRLDEEPSIQIEAILDAVTDPDHLIRTGAKNQLLMLDPHEPAFHVLLEHLYSTTDQTVRGVLLTALARCQLQTVIDAVAARWVDSRDIELGELIQKGKWLASEPSQVKMWTALKASRTSEVVRLLPEDLDALMHAHDDQDPAVRASAATLIARLKNQETIDRVCGLVMSGSPPWLKDVAIAASYQPREQHEAATYLFLTEQFERYDELDFDMQLLRAMYETGNMTLRDRVRRTIIESGRTGYLSILAGGDIASRIGHMPPEEAQLAFRMLLEHRDWARLWKLTFESSYARGREIVGKLVDAEWDPPVEDRQVFEELRSLLTVPMVETAQEVGTIRPPAVRRAGARVKGRINALAFSPKRPILALGTGAHNVVVWDYKRGITLSQLNDFDHTVGQVAFTEDDRLICGERGRKDDAYAIWSFDWRSAARIGQHRMSVTALEPITGARVLSAGRDNRVVIWDASNGDVRIERTFAFWAREARVSPDRKSVALLHDGVTLASLPELLFAANTGDDWLGVAKCAAFAPDVSSVIVGMFNGDVLHCDTQNRRLRPVARLFHHAAAVQGVEALPKRAVVLSAGADGVVQFFAWPSGASLGKVTVPGERLLSVHVSPDGDFMGIGDADTQLSLWDLRVMDIAQLFERPLASSVPRDLRTVEAIAQDRGSAPQLRAGARFLGALLRHRLRHAIQVDDVPSILAGEYEIEIR